MINQKATALSRLNNKYAWVVDTLAEKVRNLRFVPPDMMSSVEFMDAAKKKKVLKQWEQFVKSGFKRRLFVKEVYEHLHLHCSFIAHYNIEGFYCEYWENDENWWAFHGFDSFIRQFSVWGDYTDINSNMLHILHSYFVELRKTLRDQAAELYRSDWENLHEQYAAERQQLREKIDSLRQQVVDLTTRYDDMDEDSFAEEMVAMYSYLFPGVDLSPLTTSVANM